MIFGGSAPSFWRARTATRAAAASARRGSPAVLLALAGKREWTNYTFTVKARKLSGQEGFLILFRIGGNEERTWWNLGGWGNARHAVEMGGIVGEAGELEHVAAVLHPKFGAPTRGRVTSEDEGSHTVIAPGSGQA